MNESYLGQIFGHHESVSYVIKALFDLPRFKFHKMESSIFNHFYDVQTFDFNSTSRSSFYSSFFNSVAFFFKSFATKIIREKKIILFFNFHGKIRNDLRNIFVTLVQNSFGCYSGIVSNFCQTSTNVQCK